MNVVIMDTADFDFAGKVEPFQQALKECAKDGLTYRMDGDTFAVSLFTTEDIIFDIVYLCVMTFGVLNVVTAALVVYAPSPDAVVHLRLRHRIHAWRDRLHDEPVRGRFPKVPNSGDNFPWPYVHQRSRRTDARCA